MSKLNKYSDFINEIHLNPLQIGKRKWNMPGGLSLYSKGDGINHVEFEKFINDVETLRKYFPKYFNHLTLIDNMLLNDFKSNYHNSQNFVWFKVTELLGKIDSEQANPFPTGEFLGYHMEVNNYLVIECYNSKLTINWIQTFLCDAFGDRLENTIGLPNDRFRHGIGNMLIYLHPEVDISVGDKVFDQSDLDWESIKDFVVRKIGDKSDKKSVERMKLERRRKLREPFFEELQDTLFDLTLSLSDLLDGDVKVERDDILNYNDIFSLCSSGEDIFKLKDDDHLEIKTTIIYEISKELKQIDINIKNMDFGDGKLSDYVTWDFTLETGKYKGGDLDLSIYFYWQDRWK